MPFNIVADNFLKKKFFPFSEEIQLVISFQLSIRQTIHVLFSQEEKIRMMSVAAPLRVNHDNDGYMIK